MLFSHDEVARDVTDGFEPVWVSVRPVPKVTIDFGDGRVVRRTLHGNIATWICDADGRALDVIPGVYTTAAYRERLAEGRALAASLAGAGADAVAGHRTHHALQAALHSGWPRANPTVSPFVAKGAIEGPVEGLLAADAAPATAGGATPVVELPFDLGTALAKFRVEHAVETAIAGSPALPASAAGDLADAGAKTWIESPVEDAGGGGAPATFYSATAPGEHPGVERTTLRPGGVGAKGAIERPVERALAGSAAGPRVPPGGETPPRPRADDALLAADVQFNATVRRLQVHRMLAETGPVPFDTLTRRLYRDVLHADLDDPWLGLGDALFSTYPFDE